ncbi:asparagine synthase-related protein [Streptomyces sp. NBC_00989]|uniref:asparagine synthase-related protein n=1 Tax=Streptomyces sp. NBC_00989 TaxID=2903705 RepID=UPI0038646A8B|nr:asparagine synthase-related protein [Streptomyces sp. NBC_00989]
MDFVVLPDSPAAPAVAEPLTRAADVRVVRHASGRPWLVGRWADEELTLVSAGARRVAVLGRSTVDRHRVERALAQARSLGQLDDVARSLPGCFHLVASFDGWTRAQGSLSTARQIFYADVGGIAVAADGPRRLAQWAGTLRGDDGTLTVDRDLLALRLLTPVPPWPLSLRPVWSRVSAVGVGCRLELDSDGSAREVRWWRPPEPDVATEQAAVHIREALLACVGARTGATVSADLSGGLDSTSLCFLADAAGADLVTHHWKPEDRANDDTEWAERAARHLPAARHHVGADRNGPSWYETTATVDSGHEEGPLPWARNRAHMRRLLSTMAADGSRCHLLGIGGDELFGVLPTALWSLVRGHPLGSLARIHRFRVLNRWTLTSTVRGLADGTSFAAWLRSAADRLTEPAPGPGDALLGWGWEPRLPPWATVDAVDAVRRLLRDTAEREHPDPHHRDRAQHQMLDIVVQSGSAMRQLDAAFDDLGVACEAPFLDDRVVEAALSVRIDDRLVSGDFKPTLRRAVRGIVPEEILARRSKGEFSAEAFQGMRRNRGDLLDLCDDLRLSRLGLVDPDALRTALLGLKTQSWQLVPYENTLACESWLRSVAAPAPGVASLAGETP